MRAVDLIRKKRDGGSLTTEEIGFLVRGYVSGAVPDYQMSAFLMSVLFVGMSAEETGDLTRAMIGSGEVLDLSSLGGPLIDKHSTGGVGDKVSLVLAPLAAACGIQVPMMSGRGLGHTGGTLDKLESIPGYRTNLTNEEFVRCIERCGFAMVGQSERIVPADRKMYALRDVTATVESIPLITASILSKKFAEGAEGLVFDIKAGSGAFMKTQEDAVRLAESLYRTGRALNRQVRAVITSMEQPLGLAAGNFLEVEEAVETLRGDGPEDLLRVTLRLAAHMIVLGGICATVGEGEELAAARLADGSAWKRFLENVVQQGGDRRVVEAPDKGPKAPVTLPLLADASGYVSGLDAFGVGMAAVLLGAGRARQGEAVLPDVGVRLLKKVGDSVAAGDELCRIYARDRRTAERVSADLRAAYRVSPERPPNADLVLQEIVD